MYLIWLSNECVHYWQTACATVQTAVKCTPVHYITVLSVDHGLCFHSSWLLAPILPVTYMRHKSLYFYQGASGIQGSVRPSWIKWITLTHGNSYVAKRKAYWASVNHRYIYETVMNRAMEIQYASQCWVVYMVMDGILDIHFGSYDNYVCQIKRRRENVVKWMKCILFNASGRRKWCSMNKTFLASSIAFNCSLMS